MNSFDYNEFDNRVKKAKLLMENNDLDIIVITSQHNFRYFTGLDSHFWESPTRPWFLLLSQKNPPIAVIPSIGKTSIQKTWIKNIKTWESPNPNDEGLSLLKDTIISIKSGKSLVGFEMGLESHLRMPINDFNNLKKSLPKHKFVDASPIIWKLRMIKSNNEISKMKEIISLASDVFDELPKLIKIGQSEIEICKIVKKRMFDLGADHIAYMSCASGQGGYNQIICNPTNKKVSDGDILVIDSGATLDGYFCDFDRNFGFGKISDSSNLAYEIIWEAAAEGMNKAKPGNTCADVCNAMLKILNKNMPKNNDIGRMGHGIGLQLTEPPSIMIKDETILEENMVMAIEPCLEYAPGTMIVQEENILITKNGFERLTTRTPKNIPIIS